MEILIIIFFVLLNGIFSMSEIAVISSRKAKLDTNIKKGSKQAAHVLKVKENPDKFLSTIQIAITTIGLIIGLYTGETYVTRFAKTLSLLGIDIYVATVIARVIVVCAATFFMLIFGELLPKRIGMSNPEKVAAMIIRPMQFLSRLFAPFVWFLAKTTGGLAKLLRLNNHSVHNATEEEIKSMIDESVDAGEIDEAEQDIVNRVFDLDDRKIESLMTPRNELQWVEQEDLLRNLIKRVNKDEIHYIYPVCEHNLDNIVGVMYIKDMFPITESSFDCRVKDIMREPNFIHESVSIYSLLEMFKKTKIHYAFIIDEFGMVQGMITMNDILEAIIGNSSEMETDINNQDFIRRDDGSYLIDGQYPFYDFLSHFEMEDNYQDYGYNTVSGLILAITGKIPKEGDIVYWNHFKFEIVDMDAARIDKLLVTENKDGKDK